MIIPMKSISCRTELPMEILYQSAAFVFAKDRIRQDGFEAIALSPVELISNYKSPGTKEDATKNPVKISASWKLTKDISAFPVYQSGIPLMDAVYQLSLEEMVNAVEPDGTFRTGKEWAGVWTRDISYSIILSMATLQPEVAQKSLLKKVRNNRIVQDTGTGGSWPVSSDRMIWAVAAWEVYKVNGDRQWLSRAYQVIKNSIEDDLENIYDAETGLVRGESSFLDWREQTYPRWMDSADIYASENLGTNAVHYQANKVLAEMADLLDQQAVADKHRQLALQIKKGINTQLWMPEKGYYGQYLYGRSFPVLSPRTDSLGEALAVLFDIAGAEHQQEVIANTPVTPFGIPCIYPQIPDIPAYHNDGIWPFVQSFWAYAAAKAGHAESLLYSIAAIHRPVALFLTNQENFVGTTGDYAGTEVNSSNMLWSLSGSIGLVHHVIFGINIQKDSLVFKPFVPEALQGQRSLNNYKYRDSVLDISLSGYGNVIHSILMDGKELPQATIDADLSGRHEIDIVLADNSFLAVKHRLVENHFSVGVPKPDLKGDKLQWAPVPDALTYTVWHNGQPLEKTTATAYTTAKNGEYQVTAEDAAGLTSFASEPVFIGPPDEEQWIAMHGGAAGLNISEAENLHLKFSLNILQEGIYALRFRYANGNGPVSTENKCAIRTFWLDGIQAGTFVFPQRGEDNWSDWGFSNILKLGLTAGTHHLGLSLENWNENMNGHTNQAKLDYLSVIKIG